MVLNSHTDVVVLDYLNIYALWTPFGKKYTIFDGCQLMIYVIKKKGKLRNR